MSVKASITVSIASSATSTRSCSRVSMPRFGAYGPWPRYFGMSLRSPGCHSRVGAPATPGRRPGSKLLLDRGQFLGCALHPRAGKPVPGVHGPADPAQPEHDHPGDAGVVEVRPGEGAGG